MQALLVWIQLCAFTCLHWSHNLIFVESYIGPLISICYLLGQFNNKKKIQKNNKRTKSQKFLVFLKKHFFPDIESNFFFPFKVNRE